MTHRMYDPLHDPLLDRPPVVNADPRHTYSLIAFQGFLDNRCSA